MTTLQRDGWLALADKILWVLENRNDLLTAQLRFYEKFLKPRNWRHVARDHLDLLDVIAQDQRGTTES